MCFMFWSAFWICVLSAFWSSLSHSGCVLVVRSGYVGKRILVVCSGSPSRTPAAFRSAFPGLPDALWNCGVRSAHLTMRSGVLGKSCNQYLSLRSGVCEWALLASCGSAF